ncbi:hypothetical protein [Xylophilus sp. GOD-11R]|uniref:hypothetical protein n=1 Tax=Xylophilus sp. GOD-11R TaxID=3089814 RepID=UPI00298CE4A2|nr:hypothetical protein [Xylophilus sp. GOD-11R]WPB58614.1 hypothetical protein R9X41_08260 [Xylophilus sp. GOD-11R]
MQKNEMRLDLTGFSEADFREIQEQADEWGVAFDQACLLMLLQESRRRRTTPRPGAPGLFSRLFGSRAAH